MTEQTKSPRIKPADICMSDASPFQQHYEARTVHPLKQVAVDTAFTELRAMLRPGDEVSICQYDKADYRSARLVAFCKVRVVHVGARSVEVTPPYGAFEVPAPGSGAVVQPEADVLFSDGTWEAEWGGPTHLWRVKSGAGEILAKGLTKEGAERIASGDGIGVGKDDKGQFFVHDPERLLQTEAA